MSARIAGTGLVFAILTACGGSGPAIVYTNPPVVQNPPDAVTCGFGARVRAGLNKDHWHQWCERARKMEGPYERYNLEGTLLIKGSFKNNSPDGLWTWNHDDGSRLVTGSYQEGGRTGEWEWRHVNGETAQTGGFYRDAQDGEWLTFFSDRTPASKGRFVQGKRNGLWTWWTEDGRTMREQSWQDGALLADVTPGREPELINP